MLGGAEYPGRWRGVPWVGSVLPGVLWVYFSGSRLFELPLLDLCRNRAILLPESRVIRAILPDPGYPGYFYLMQVLTGLFLLGIWLTRAIFF